MPRVNVDLPPLLRAGSGESEPITVDGATVEEALQVLVASRPALRPKILTPGGKLRGSVAVFLNEEDIRYRERERTPLQKGDTLRLVSALPGG